MKTEHDFQIGARDYVVLFELDDRDLAHVASFDGPIAIERYEDDGSTVPIDWSSLTTDEREELRVKLQAYADRDAELRRAAAYDDAADDDYDAWDGD